MGALTVAGCASAAEKAKQAADAKSLRRWRDCDENLKIGTDVRRDLKWRGYERK
jgi:hypothetical protein